MCFDLKWFKTYYTSSGGNVTLGNDTIVQVIGIGIEDDIWGNLDPKGCAKVPDVRNKLVGLLWCNKVIELYYIVKE